MTWLNVIGTLATVLAVILIGLPLVAIWLGPSCTPPSDAADADETD